MFIKPYIQISSRKIKSSCNNNSDEESTFNFSHYMDTRQSERCKFKEIAKIQILEFFTQLNARHTWSLLMRCVNMKWVRLVLWKIHSKQGPMVEQSRLNTTPCINIFEKKIIIIKKQKKQQTRFCPQTDRRARWNQYTSIQLRGAGV